MEKQIKNAILAMKGPFNKTDLFYRMRHFHGIENHKLICDVLDTLCENEVVRYIEVENNRWGFVFN